jgi:hypothetical protein
MRALEFIFESGKRLVKAGVTISRVNKQDFLLAKKSINPVLKKAGIDAGWTAGGAGSFDPEHDYGGGGREDSGDIDIMIDPQELLEKFPKDIEQYVKEYNQAAEKSGNKKIGPKALANALTNPQKTIEYQWNATKWALAEYMTKNGFPTDPGTLTVQYSKDSKNFSIDLIPRPRNAWSLHTHDFTKDPGMRGGDLWVNIYPLLTKISSNTTFVDPKTGEEKGNLQYSPDRGLVDRTTNQVVAINKNEIAKILIGPEATARDISSVSGIKMALQKHPEKWDQVKQLFA